ncbi:phage tail protein [Salipiger sp. IMCC34102]|uniref:contractile injection system protein, VgrG/Pvc8 family n=1 Tax=Salipiger sp. IMCC34102 TaxID=2510647 RepID=UPI00101C211F|nr:contractile injection system protein, VgrG/Pvc8 family [Salipiger sp. IMCC34102]RYH02830.1 phage tail protein [Salipiger sp. IMCC34102]
MTPLFQIFANDEDVTAAIADRLVDLTITDEDGLKADRLTITLDNRDRIVAIPPAETKLRVFLGHRETRLTDMGAFVLERRSGRGTPDTMTLVAKAADMASSIRAPRTRAWRDTSLGDIVRTIAAEANLTPAVGTDIAATPYRMIAQSAERDLHLLTRLCAVLDATAKPADGRLVVLRRGAGVTADGEAIPVVPILRHRMERYAWDLGERGKYKSVTAEWSEPATATLHKVTVGDGSPNRRLRQTFGTADEAQRAARAALDRSACGETTVDADLAGFWPQLFAGGLVEFPDLMPEFEGKRFQLTSVEHVFKGGLTTRFESELSA